MAKKKRTVAVKPLLKSKVLTQKYDFGSVLWRWSNAKKTSVEVLLLTTGKLYVVNKKAAQIFALVGDKKTPQNCIKALNKTADQNFIAKTGLLFEKMHDMGIIKRIG